MDPVFEEMKFRTEIQVVGGREVVEDKNF